MTAAFTCRVNHQTELRLIDTPHSGELFSLLEANREHLRRWHPWVDMLRTTPDVEKAVVAWQLLQHEGRGLFCGIWFDGQLCGMLNHQNLDHANQWSALSYWLAEPIQGRGVMTACCAAFIDHSFDSLKLHRLTIECATENERSRDIPERLGFRLEGIVRGIEWLHGRHVDHALYGLLHDEWKDRASSK